MKLRYWYKIDQSKQPIPGSNIRRKSRPGPNYQWKEILDPCCSPLDITCSCGPRYFIQLDGRGKPVDGSLIKRAEEGMPEGTDGTKFYELQWKSPCCGGITYDFSLGFLAGGTFTVSVNGVLKLSTMTAKSGKIAANKGDSIIVNLIHSTGAMDNSLVLTGGHTFVSTSQPASYSFTWNGKDTNIEANIEKQPDIISWNFNVEGGYSGSVQILDNADDVTGGVLIDPNGGTFGSVVGHTITVHVNKLVGASTAISMDLSNSMIDHQEGTSPATFTFVYTGGQLTMDIFVPIPG